MFVCKCVCLRRYITKKVAQNDQIGLVFISYLISFSVESVCDLNTSTPYLQCFNIIHLEFALFFIYLFTKETAVKLKPYPILFCSVAPALGWSLSLSLFWRDFGAVYIQTSF